MNEDLRNEVKLLKAMQGITYKELAEDLEIRQDSFSNWLRGKYELGLEKQKLLQDLVDILKEY